nr:unnamed protein product [Digitaria exilis]
MSLLRPPPTLVPPPRHPHTRSRGKHGRCPAPATNTFAVEDYLVSKSLTHLKSGSNEDALLAFLMGLGLSPKKVADVALREEGRRCRPSLLVLEKGRRRRPSLLDPEKLLRGRREGAAAVGTSDGAAALPWCRRWPQEKRRHRQCPPPTAGKGEAAPVGAREKGRRREGGWGLVTWLEVARVGAGAGAGAPLAEGGVAGSGGGAAGEGVGRRQVDE